MGSKNSGKKDMKKANQLMKQAVARLEAVGVPSVEAQRIVLQDPELVGLLEAERLQESELANISQDPRLKQAQYSALEEMSGLAETGLGAQEHAAFNELRRNAAAEAEAQKNTILQNAAATGTLDSGNALMAQLNAGQNSSNQMAAGADRLAAQAAQARREALGMKANYSAQMGNQDFNQKSSVAQAQDTINRFNTQNRQEVNQYNLGNRQTVANQANTNRNQEQMHNKGLLQQKFQNDLSKATGVSQATQGLANNYQAQGQAAAQGAANLNGALLNGGMKAATAYFTGGAPLPTDPNDPTKKPGTEG